MVEQSVLDIQCSKCYHSWRPFGSNKKVVPLSATVTCPKCGFSEQRIWGDEEIRKKYYQKELGLLDNNTKTKLEEMNKKIELLQQEYDLEKKKNELLDKRIAQIDNWKDDRERDFQIIQEYAKQIEDENQFKEDHK